jgi:hypothetical protein
MLKVRLNHEYRVAELTASNQIQSADPMQSGLLTTAAVHPVVSNAGLVFHPAAGPVVVVLPVVSQDVSVSTTTTAAFTDVASVNSESTIAFFIAFLYQCVYEQAELRSVLGRLDPGKATLMPEEHFLWNQ